MLSQVVLVLFLSGYECKVSAWLQMIIHWSWVCYAMVQAPLPVEFEAGCCCHMERDVVCKIPEVQTAKGKIPGKMERESSSPGKKPRLLRSHKCA